ncbi:MAG: prephenate dehydrogenase [Anaeroplasmataceae bacterium]
MKILIVGLGLMGGSYAMGLSLKGHEVYGVDTNLESIKYAKDNKYIIDGGIDASLYIPLVDLIVIGLYPSYILNFLNEYKSLFKDGQIITDLCGVKTSFVYDAQMIPMKAEYISHHPMAGREKSGILYANIEMFKKANFLVCPTDKNTNEAIEVIKSIGNDLEFGRISVMDPHKHDSMIGYTSQLTHAIAVSLVNADHDIDTASYVGDSYRDLTRIAKINEVLWSDLFFQNKDILLSKINDFEEQLDLLKAALENNDEESLKKLFIKSTKHRKEME